MVGSDSACCSRYFGWLGSTHRTSNWSSPPAAMAAGLGEGDGAPYGCSGGAPKIMYLQCFMQEERGVRLDVLDATIISSNFWPLIQAESLNVPASVDQLLSEYSRRFHEIKTPRKLLWKKNIGTVKLELQFEDRIVQFTVSPVHAAIIMQFQEKTSWTSRNLAAAIGVPVDALNRRISFWVSKGILAESVGTESDDHVFTIVDDMADVTGKGYSSGCCEELLVADEEGERAVTSVEEQLAKEMTVYEKFIFGMLTNFGSMALDRIHNTLKVNLQQNLCFVLLNRHMINHFNNCKASYLVWYQKRS